MTIEWRDLDSLQPEDLALQDVLLLQDASALRGHRVVLLADALNRMMHHAGTTTGEVMGILRGRVVQQGIVVLTAEPILAAESQRTSVLATADSWQTAWTVMQSDAFPIVGWYHSHPGFGVFFSDTDRATQRSHFQQPWQAGIVVDPLQDAYGAFVGPESEPADVLIVKSVRS